MKVHVTGKKQSEWTNQDTGELMQTATIFFTYKAPADNSYSKFAGHLTDKVSVPFTDYDDLPVDCDYVLDFDRNGKLIDYDVV